MSRSTHTTSSTLPVTFTNPTANSTYFPDDSITVEWSSDTEVKSPIFRLCLASVLHHTSPSRKRSRLREGSADDNEYSSEEDGPGTSEDEETRPAEEDEAQSTDDNDSGTGEETTSRTSEEDSGTSEEDSSRADAEDTSRISQEDSGALEEDGPVRNDQDVSRISQDASGASEGEDTKSSSEDDSESGDEDKHRSSGKPLSDEVNSQSNVVNDSNASDEGNAEDMDDSKTHSRVSSDGSATSDDYPDSAQDTSPASGVDQSNLPASDPGDDGTSSEEEDSQYTTDLPSDTSAHQSWPSSSSQNLSSTVADDTATIGIKATADNKTTTGNCGAPMTPLIQSNRNNDYLVSFIVPSKLPDDPHSFYIQMDDGQGSKARSAVFTLSNSSRQSSTGAPESSAEAQTSIPTVVAGPDVAQQPFSGASQMDSLALPQSATAVSPSNAALSALSSPTNPVTSHAPLPPTAALAVPLSLIGGVLLIATFLAIRSRRSTRKAKAPALYPGFPPQNSRPSSGGQQDMPVPLFMATSFSSLEKERTELSIRGPVRRATARDLPVNITRSNSSASYYPQSLALAHVRGAAATPARDKELPTQSAQDEFEDIRIVDEGKDNGENKPPAEKKSLYHTIAQVVGARGS